MQATPVNVHEVGIGMFMRVCKVVKIDEEVVVQDDEMVIGYAHIGLAFKSLSEPKTPPFPFPSRLSYFTNLFFS